MGGVEQLAAQEVPNVLERGESVTASALAHFGHVGQDAVIPNIGRAGISPAASVLQDGVHLMVKSAARKHWWVVVTDQRLLVFRLFEGRPALGASGIELADSCALAELLDRAEWGGLGGHLDVHLHDHAYQFHFPARPTKARAVIDAFAAWAQAQQGRH